MPSSPISSAGQPLARPDDYRSIDSKVHRALSLFESLRASLDAPGSPTSAFIAMSARGGGDGLADASEASPTTSTDITGTSRPLASFVPTKGEAAAVISAGTYTEEELTGLTKAELRKKLVTAGNIMKRLHAKNQGLVQQVKYLDTIMKESEAKPSNEPRASPHQATEDRTSELLENLRRSHATELKTHAARHADAMAKQEAYLYTKEEQIEELLGGNADLQSQLRQLQESLRQMEVGSTQQRADMEDKLKRKVKKLKQQRDDLESKQATLQMECDRACNAARKAEEELKSCQPSTHQSSAPSHEGLPNVVGGSSGHTTVVQDAVTTLQFRLQQANNQVQKLMDVQLDAILRDDRNNGPQHTELINRDVKQLFGIMKHSMIGDAVMHEAERSRMNEVLYALERREASSFNNRSL